MGRRLGDAPGMASGRPIGQGQDELAVAQGRPAVGAGNDLHRRRSGRRRGRSGLGVGTAHGVGPTAWPGRRVRRRCRPTARTRSTGAAGSGEGGGGRRVRGSCRRALAWRSPRHGIDEAGPCRRGRRGQRGWDVPRRRPASSIPRLTTLRRRRDRCPSLDDRSAAVCPEGDSRSSLFVVSHSGVKSPRLRGESSGTSRRASHLGECRPGRRRPTAGRAGRPSAPGRPLASHETDPVDEAECTSWTSASRSAPGPTASA
jgi:hypothetical protein